VIEPVSADNLCKTGIFADEAGDFRNGPLTLLDSSNAVFHEIWSLSMSIL
jgi:hypothetical protein